MSDRPSEIQDPGAAARASGAAPGWRAFWFLGLLTVELFGVSSFQAPLRRFSQFAFWDSGGELAIQDLLARGYLPAVDFGYAYGLAPLLIGRLWYGLAGPSPWAFRVQAMACMWLTAWGLARFAAARRVGPAGLVLIVLALPDLMLPSYITLVHCLEQAMLTHALAEHARGRRGGALAIVTACCFVKPALAFLYGLALLIAIAAANRKADLRAWARTLGPAALTAVVLSAVLAAAFGPAPLARTIFPRTGLEVYRLNHYGFFRGVGREFWLLRHAGLRDYFRYEVGFWLAGTALLAWGGLLGLWRLWRGAGDGDAGLNDEIVVTCAALHLGFVVFLFGHRGTWVYSFAALVLGLAALGRRGRWASAAVWVLAAMLLVSDRSKAVEVRLRWKVDAPAAETLGLWSSPGERAEWAKARELTRGQTPVLLAFCEGAPVLVPGFAPPVGGYFIPGYTLPVEARRKAAQLGSASMIVSAHPPDWPGFTFWPEVAAALDGCELVWRGETLRVYRRRDAARGRTPAEPLLRPDASP